VLDGRVMADTTEEEAAAAAPELRRIREIWPDDDRHLTPSSAAPGGVQLGDGSDGPRGPVDAAAPIKLVLRHLSTRLRALFLPEGFPASVTPDYLPYQLWSIPTHITARNGGRPRQDE
jgi:hypothetical protein